MGDKQIQRGKKSGDGKLIGLREVELFIFGENIRDIQKDAACKKQQQKMAEVERRVGLMACVGGRWMLMTK